MYKTLHKKQGSVTVQLRFARSSVTFCAKRDNLTFASDSTVGKYAGNIIAFPPTVLVDKSGNIISVPFLGGIDDQATYEQLMKQIQSILDQK